jgi:hypothetical protein
MVTVYFRHGAPDRSDQAAVRPAGRRWWHVDLGDGTASWSMDVRVDEITGGPVRPRALPVPVFPRAGVVDRAFLGPGWDTGALLLRA